MIIAAHEIEGYEQHAVSIFPGGHNRDIVLICEHAGNRIPESWHNLGLPDAFLETHFGFDLGSKALTLAIARKLGATAIVSEYSRLFLDYNRKAHDPACIRPDMGGIPIPLNLNVSEEERHLRVRIARDPVEAAIRDWVEGPKNKAKAVISLHSFSPVWELTFRKCEIGVMWKLDDRLPTRLMQSIRECGPFQVDDNLPYSFKDNDWFTLDRHGIAIGVPNAYIEVRNNLIDDTQSLEKVSTVLSAAIERACQAISHYSHHRDTIA